MGNKQDVLEDVSAAMNRLEKGVQKRTFFPTFLGRRARGLANVGIGKAPFSLYGRGAVTVHWDVADRVVGRWWGTTLTESLSGKLQPWPDHRSRCPRSCSRSTTWYVGREHRELRLSLSRFERGDS